MMTKVKCERCGTTYTRWLLRKVCPTCNTRASERPWSDGTTYSSPPPPSTTYDSTAPTVDYSSWFSNDSSSTSAVSTDTYTSSDTSSSWDSGSGYSGGGGETGGGGSGADF